MDWKSIAPLVGAVAPFAGKLLGGLIPFPGAALIGEQFGKIIARQFGVAETPAAVSDALANATEETARAKINAALEQARAEIAGFVDIEKAYLHAIEVSLSQTGATMRAEIGHEHWFFNGWRPACGWLFVLFSAVFGFQLCVAAALSAFFGNQAPLKALNDAWPAFLALLGPLALMVGVYVIGRSGEKGRAIETGSPMPNAKAAIPATPAKPPVAVSEKPINKPPLRTQTDPLGSRT
jgi:hypothetical protein